MKETIRRVLRNLDSEEQELQLEGKTLSKPSSSEYTRLPTQQRERFICVDGGSAPIVQTPAACVLFCRIVSLKMDADMQKEIVKKEGFVIARHEKGMIKTVFISDEEEKLFEKKAEDDDPLFAAANLGRKLLEWKTVAVHDNNNPESLIVWDGSLTAQEPIEKEYLDRMPNVIGFSKTTGALGSFGVFFSAAPRAPWYVSAGDHHFVKLHAKSRHVFRVDTHHPDRIKKLVPWSVDAAFIGYPYPLVLVDQLARVSNQEIEALRLRFRTEAGSRWEKLEQETAARDAHAILDKMQF